MYLLDVYGWCFYIRCVWINTRKQKVGNLEIFQLILIRCPLMMFLYQMSVDKNKEKDIWQFGDPSTYIN